MTPPDSNTSPPPEPPRPGAPPPTPPPARPWRAEGLPPGAPPVKPKRSWTRFAVAMAAYFAIFGLLTLQDRFNGPQIAVPYTELKSQVAKKNVTAVFSRGDSIE